MEMAATRIEKADDLWNWKSRARCLQLRLRDRFRVTVDRRRRIFSDSETTLRRLLHRFRDFRSQTIPSSSALIRNRVGKNFNSEEESVFLRMLQAVAVPVLGNVCHVFMHGFNRIQVYGIEKLHEALLHRPKDRSLVTVSNHVASVDDPFIIAALLPPRVLLDAQNLRWTLCATDRCFKNPVTSAFFRSVKVLPVSRGDGIYQKGMDMAISKLNRGGWVHIFPEGSRSRDGGKTMGSLKRGVGRLVLDVDHIPMVIPFVHTGMQEIMPVGASLPRIGKTVTVLVGDPIHFDDLLDIEEAKSGSTGNLYSAVASRIGHRLHELKVQVDQLAFQQATDLKNHRESNTERAAGILQQIDWESFGMANLISNNDEALPMQEIRTRQSEPAFQEAAISDRYFKIGITSRMHSFMGPAELMGFAARGLLINHRAEKSPASARVVGPLKAWKQYLEANVFGQWNHSEL